MSLNKALIFGNATRDPETKSLPNGTTVTTFSLATHRTYTDKNNERQEETAFHNIVAFGKVAETIGQYVKKGSSLFVEGRLQTRSWEGPDGTKRYRTEIIAENFSFGDRPKGRNEESQETEDKEDSVQTADSDSNDINPDDIPF